MTSGALAKVRPSWIAFGWFIAAAVAAFLILALVAVGLMSPDTTEEETVWIAGSLVLGFLAGGFFAGARVGAAPVAHGVGIGLFSLVVWLLANLIPGEATGWTAWRALPTAQALALIFLQAVAAVVGARIGVRWFR